MSNEHLKNGEFSTNENLGFKVVGRSTRTIILEPLGVTTPSKKYPHGRCRAMKTPSNAGARCRQDCVPGENRCVRHLGIQDNKTRYHVHRFYLKALRPTLAQALEDSVNGSSIGETLSLLPEVELSRHAASHSVEQYAEAVETGDKDAIVLAAELMKEELAVVSARVKDAATVEHTKSQIVSELQNCMGTFLTTILLAAQEVFQDDHAVKEFEAVIRERMQLADESQERLGTDLTPDQLRCQVSEIDALAPADVVEGVESEEVDEI